MKAHTIVLSFCLALSAGCLGGAYILGGYWLIVPAFVAMAIFWIITKKQSVVWSASGLLLIYVALAAIGMMINLSIFMMVLGCASALACWDLGHFRLTLVDVPSPESQMVAERDRLQSLAVAIFTGLLLAFIGSSLNLHLPFVVIVVLVLMAVGCLTYGLRYDTKNR